MTIWWKGLVIILLLVSLISTWAQLAQIQHWMNLGPRFTAEDGRALCERVRALEATSYGYQAAGKTSLTCDYLRPK